MVDQLIEKTAPAVKFGGHARKGGRTRERIMDIAEESMLHKGFSATSIEDLVEAAGITKSGFFYHFKDKNDLARAIVSRFVERDTAILDELSARARALSDDPLQSFLIFMKLFAEMMDDLPGLHPGCLAAAITYQDRVFDAEVRHLNRLAVAGWRSRFHAWLCEIAALYEPRIPVDLEDMADHFNVVVDGGIITSRAMEDKSIIGRQARLMHDHVKLLFGGR